MLDISFLSKSYRSMVESRIDDFARGMRRGVRIKRMVTKWFTPTWGTTGAQNSPTVALPNGLPKLGRNLIRIAAQDSVRKILVFLHADEIIQRVNTQSPRASF